MPQKQIKSLQTIGLIYFIYLFLYSGLEFTVTFLMYHKFGYTSMDQAKMFLTTGKYKFWMNKKMDILIPILLFRHYNDSVTRFSCTSSSGAQS